MDLLTVVSGSQEEQKRPSQISESKDKKKKKMSVSTLKKQQARAAEEVRQKLLKQKKEYLNGIKIRAQAEWEMNHAKSLVYESEFEKNQALLENSFQKLVEIENMWKEYLQEERKKYEWELYVKCGGLPNPSCIPDINSYIFVRTEMDTNTQMNHCIEKTEEMMELLRGLKEVVENLGPDRPPHFLKDMKELRTQLRSLLQNYLDKATFRLFSRIENDMESINVTTSKYFARSKHFEMSLWAELITPIASKRKDQRPPLKVTFEKINVTVTVPVSLLDIHKVMRAMWLHYDHWSDKCMSSDCFSLPSYNEKNMFELFLEEFSLKKSIMEQRERQEDETKRKVAGITLGSTLSQEILAWESEPQRALSDEILFREFEEETKLARQIKEVLKPFEVNMRTRRFLGSLLLLEIHHQPPQAQCFRIKHCVTLREEPPTLKPVDFDVKYSPVEEGDEENQKDNSDKGRRRRFRAKLRLEGGLTKEEEKKQKLIVVRLNPTDSVIWYERPEVAHWDPVHDHWSEESIHDKEFDEEGGAITFKTGRLGLFGLHVKRYLHFPYKDWLFEAHEEGGIHFYLKTSQSEFHFRIKEGKVCLESMKDVPSKAMNWILGNYYPPAELKEHLQNGGIDVFPQPDAACYIEDIESKRTVIERNIYQVWGLFSKTFRFKRSKFNQSSGRKNIVFQAQEVYKGHQVDFCLIQTAMCSCYVLNINEESEEYSSQEAPYMESCVDFYSLLLKNCTKSARRQSEATCYLLIQTVQEFLGYVRPISFS